MKKNRNIALGLNIVGFVAGLVLTVCAVLFILTHHHYDFDDNSDVDNATN